MTKSDISQNFTYLNEKCTKNEILLLCKAYDLKVQKKRKDEISKILNEKILQYHVMPCPHELQVNSSVENPSCDSILPYINTSEDTGTATENLPGTSTLDLPSTSSSNLTVSDTITSNLPSISRLDLPNISSLSGSEFQNQPSTSGNGVHLAVRFSRTELYYSYYMSDDNTTLSNVNTDETSKSASARLLTYRGTISDVCVGHDDLIYYEISYAYSIRTELTNYFDKEDILEVGIAERSNVDKYKNAGAAASGWSFNMYYTRSFFYFSYVYINARHNGRSHTAQNLFTTYIGEELHGQLKIFINTRRDEFTVMHNDLKVYVFDEVKSNETLCPVFGVYNPKYVNVQLKILNSLNFSMYAW
ncbi:unnamed protein product [Mytilus coruscus]|uniref:Uncharacterized protein n=1 Tax=Mytilus coruscus TaxID=42192 RepID=A0A6J8A3L9_MYTCO|nr:unnamed protein product [Mytilus coruscus]